MARKIQPWAGGRYVAGLWESDLIFGLLWRTSDSLLSHVDFTVTDWMRNRRKPDYRFLRTNTPSWLWASVEGPALHTPRRKFVVITAEASIPSAGLQEHDDPFGAIDGRLCITAPIRAATLEFGFRDYGSRYFKGRITLETLCPDTGRVKSETIGEAYTDVWDTTPKFAWCAAVIRQYGLLLESVNQDQRIYRRIGLFYIFESHWEVEPKFSDQKRIELEIV